MRYLAVDLGTKRIGIAVSDPDGRFASPLTVIQRRGGVQDLRAVARLVEDYEVGLVVVGMPVNLRGEMALAAERASVEIEQLRGLLSVPLETYDERLTSAAAGRAMLDGGLRRQERKDRVDKVAAALLLQSYLDRMRFEHAPPQE